MDKVGFTIADIASKFGVTGHGAFFESGHHNPRLRAHLPGASPQDHKLDFDPWVRCETVKKMRYLMRNTGLPREFRDLNALYGVGSGLSVQATTEDQSANTEMEEYYREWGRNADITGRFTMPDLEKMASHAVDSDGEIFGVKVRDDLRDPRIQFIETHRVGNFGKAAQGAGWVDGIKVSPKGSPTHIMVAGEGGKDFPVPFSAVMHIFDVESPSAYRHAPTLTHSINPLLDVRELMTLVMHAAKDGNDISRILTANSALQEDGDFSPTGLDSLGNSDPKALQKILGGKMVHLYPGEKLETWESGTPNPLFAGFADHVDRGSSLGGLPYEFAVNSSGAGGPAIRLVTAKAARRFRARTALVANKLTRPTWFYVIGDAIDRRLLKPVKGWHKIKVTGPKSITVDAGRDGESNRRDIQMGLRLPTDSYEEDGSDFIEAMEAKARLIQRVQEIAKLAKIDPAMLFNFMSKDATSDGKAATAPSAKP